MNNIDILEELKKEFDGILKEPMGKDEMSNGNLYEYERSYELNLEEIKAVETLIAENKELKEKNKELQKYMKEYLIPKSTINLVYIPKSKVEEEIDKLNKKEKDLQNSINDEEREEYSDANISFDLMDIDIRRETLQSLLGKE